MTNTVLVYCGAFSCKWNKNGTCSRQQINLYEVKEKLGYQVHCQDKTKNPKE